MPEATVDEDGDARTGKDDVGLTARLWQWSQVDAEPAASTM
jgi:hypothetical protein